MKKYWKTYFIGLLLLLITSMLSLYCGRYFVSIDTILTLIWYHLMNIQIPADLIEPDIVLMSIRFPRTIIAVITGIVLGITGVIFQGIFRNPLVSPDILGVSAGAGFGAALIIIIFGCQALLTQVGAFVFALLAVGAAYCIGMHGGKNTITILVLGGIIVSSVCTAGTSFLKYIADPYSQLSAIVFWGMGGFHSVVWDDLVYSVPIMIISIIVLFLLRWTINPISLGDEESLSLGINIKQTRLILIIFSALAVASTVSVCGIIAWVGLVVPHIGRLLCGSNHYLLIPISGIIGAIFLLIVDLIARMIAGGELPISILTSFIGGPFLAYLLIKSQVGYFSME